MLIKRVQVLWSALALAVLLVVLSGCGSNVSSPPGENVPSGSQPDRVRIVIENTSPAQQKPVVLLSMVAKVQQLYTTVLALPLMPQQQACTMEAGPHYTLTFLQGEKTLTTVVAKREGCRPVSIAGETQERQATQDFWAQLDQAINQATPVASPTVSTP